MDWNDQIKTESPGMAGGESWYEIEDLYQAFKERLIQEMRETKGTKATND